MPDRNPLEVNPEPLAKRVLAVLLDCMYENHEIPDSGVPEGAVVVKGLTRPWGFKPEKIEAHKAEIAGFCNLMHDNFQQDGGGGWSFLQLCMTKDGEHWGEHPNCEQLVVLAFAAKLGEFVLDRPELWAALPGGMPYIRFHTREYADARKH